MEDKMPTTTTTITVRDIARAIRLPDEALEIAVGRARHWTKEGVLKIVGERNPGTGRERRYDQSAVTDAVIVQWLTSAVGMPATVAAGVLEDLRRDLAKHKHAIEDTAVVMAKELGGKKWSVDVVWLSKVQKWIATRPDSAHVVIHAKAMFKHLER
jgi:hypothetical protein